MKVRKYVYSFSFFMFFMWATSVTNFPAAAGPTVDHRIYADLLRQYVKHGKVDYAGFKSAEIKLDEYLEILEKVESKSLSRNEQFAYYTNVYNAWTIKLILTKYPDIKSIKELGFLNSGPWRKKVVRLKGEMLSLDDIEHDILRPRFKDPRVHFAINCAAKSCPPLRSEPYLGDILDVQLNDSTISFLNNPNSYKFEGNTFYVSRIFKWFAEDFDNDVLLFYLRYASDELKEKLEANRNRFNIDYLQYDWDLNGL